MNIVFSESSNLNNGIFGNCQAPIRMFIEEQAEAQEQNSILKELFMMGTSDNFADTFTGMTAMNGFQPVGENGAYPTDGMQQGYEKMLRYETWKDSFAISKEMVEDAKLMDMKRQPAQFMTSYSRTRELFGASIYANAMMGKSSMTFRGKKFDLTGADGVSVFNTAHKPKVKGKSQCNMFSDAFSMDALDRMESKMHLFKGENDELLTVAPNVILIPEDPALRRQVFAAIGSDQDPVSANNAFNYQYGRWTVITWSFLNQFITDGSMPWVLMDSKHNQTFGGAVWNDRVQLEVTSDIDPNTDANLWKGRSRFNACFNDWHFAAVGGVAAGEALAG